MKEDKEASDAKRDMHNEGGGKNETAKVGRETLGSRQEATRKRQEVVLS